jgi:hypothetical protein
MSTQDALVAQAIEVLTALARQTRVRGRGTEAEATEPIDFADLAAQILTTVAANLGSVEALLAGRPGSWEADLVRKIVNGTAGEDGELMRWRTEPVRLHFSAEDMFLDFGIEDLFDQERDQAFERADAEGLTDEQREAADERAAAIERLWESDQAAYAEAYRATAQGYLTERGATCGVELAARLAPGTAVAWDGVADEIEEHARVHTALPMTGSAPDWSEGTPADALRRAGLTYTARAEAR